MYAVIQTGGKQVRVAEGDVVRIERVSGGSLKKGDELTVTEVLAIGANETLNLGKPFVEGASVKATVVREVRAPKVLAFKKKRRKGFRRLHGHRQNLLEVRIQAIQA
jgi:large subunit ribosomal protein L21